MELILHMPIRFTSYVAPRTGVALNVPYAALRRHPLPTLEDFA